MSNITIRLTVMRNLWIRWLRICSNYRNQNAVLFSLNVKSPNNTYHIGFTHQSNITSFTSWVEPTYPFWALELLRCFWYDSFFSVFSFMCFVVWTYSYSLNERVYVPAARKMSGNAKIAVNKNLIQEKWIEHMDWHKIEVQTNSPKNTTRKLKISNTNVP